MARTRTLISVLACVTLTCAAACSSLVGPQQTSVPIARGKAHLEALSTYSATMGTTIFGYGSSLPQDDSRLQLVFQGSFTRDDGRVTPVSTTVNVKVRSGSEFVWEDFGPFSHPFT